MSGWNVSNVTNMYRMFSSIIMSNTARQSLSTWNTGKATNMTEMFYWNRSTGPLNIGTWDTSKVVDFTSMFTTFQTFTMTADLSTWNTSSALNMTRMFDVWIAFGNTTNQGFNPGNIANWDTSNVVNMSSMFENNEVFNADLSGWCVGAISSEPSGFASGTTAWVLPKPVWGTCPP
jgi:hypothetical protein